MKKLITSALGLLIVWGAAAQEDPDTTRINLGEKEIIIISPGKVEVKVGEGDTLLVDDNGDYEEADEDDGRPNTETHWAGIEFGPTILLNSAMKSSFPDAPQWENDPGKSFSWNVNIIEHKFPIWKNHIGITTGLGFNFTGIGLKQQILNFENDSLWVTQDTVNKFQKNKLRATYLTVPLLVEFCTNGDGDDNGFFLAAGVIGGIRIGSSVKTTIEEDKREVKEVNRGTYALNAFRLDAAVKLGYNSWGLFANYSLLPLFDTDVTAAAYPLTFGLSYTF